MSSPTATTATASSSTTSTSPTLAALATASELARRPPPSASAAATLPTSSGGTTAAPSGSTSTSGIAGAGAGAAVLEVGAAPPRRRPGAGPRQESKTELMESAHLLCSLFGSGGGSPAACAVAAATSTTAPKTVVEAKQTAAAAAAATATASTAALPTTTKGLVPTALVRHGSKGPLKKRLAVFDCHDYDAEEEEKERQAAAVGPTSLKTAVVAAVALQRQQQKAQQQTANVSTATTTNTTATATGPTRTSTGTTQTIAGAMTTGATGTPTGDYCTILHTPHEDEMYLSPQLCLTRAQIEAFEAQPADVSSRRSAGGRSISRTLTVGQIGLRCVHCKHLTLRDRSMSAVHYPGSIRLVYQSVRNFQRNHFLQCTAMPQAVKDEFQTTRSRFVQSKGRSHVYWAKSCAEKGMVDTPEGGIRFNVDGRGDVVPANPDSAVEATEAFMAQNASRGPAARKRKADKVMAAADEAAAAAGEEEEEEDASTKTKTKKKRTAKKKKKKKAADAAAAAKTTTDNGETVKAGTVKGSTDDKIAEADKYDKEKIKEEEAPLVAIDAKQSASSAVAAVPSANVNPAPVSAAAPPLTAQVSLDAEQLFHRHLQELQQLPNPQPPQQLLLPGQGQGQQDTALAQADRMIRASMLEHQRRQLLVAQLGAGAGGAQYQPQVQAQALANHPSAASPTLAPINGGFAPSAASLLLRQQQQQQHEFAASLGLGFPESAAASALAAQQQAAQQQASAASAAVAAPLGAATAASDSSATGRAENRLYLETLDRMSASINTAQSLAAVYQANPTVVGRLQYLAANDEAAAVMHRAKVQAMNLQRIRLESRLSDLNASLGVAALQGGAPMPAHVAAAAAAGLAGALPPSQ